MNGLHKYLELTENGRPMDAPVDAPDPSEALLVLLEHARAEDGLAVEGAWRLSARVCRHLEKRHGFSPAGGWDGLAALACGCGVLQAGREAFFADMSARDIAGWTGMTARRKLLESFTRLLVPPATAAGMFILMGIHPAWGLRVAHDVHSRGREAITGRPRPALEPGWRDESLFSSEVAEIVEEAVFSAVAAIVAALRKLSPTCRYPIGALAGVIDESCAFARSSALLRLEEVAQPGLAPFLELGPDGSDGTSLRARDFATVDFLGTLLVSAGAARRFDDGTFCICEGTLDGLQVGLFDEDAQEIKLTWLLAGEAGCMVA